MAITVSDKEEQLVADFRRLPTNAADEILGFIQRLANLAPGNQIDWSDEWSEQDLRDYTAASVADLEAREND